MKIKAKRRGEQREEEIETERRKNTGAQGQGHVEARSVGATKLGRGFEQRKGRCQGWRRNTNSRKESQWGDPTLVALCRVTKLRSALGP